ncbi:MULTISPECIES: helix-turn-helix domain-containing protein [Burkholderiaceae]|uniref:helix-turn-helix domain-containing protein n=1 Tax=Burkholderiaceae TaxID=119060 RepID=UPI00160E6A3A|nr:MULTISPECIES: helix-turn-helix domain-containing protein [Burkholderiaceae]MBB2981576.1 excisionase family DNA binding protein [Paraburkholderia tropica]
MTSTAPSTPLTVKQAAQALGVSDGRVMQLLRSGVLALVTPTTAQTRSKHHLDPARVEALRAQRAANKRDPVVVEARRVARLAERQRIARLHQALARGMMTVSDAARELGVSHQAVDGQVARGTMRTVRVAGHRLVRRADLEAVKARRARG